MAVRLIVLAVAGATMLGCQDSPRGWQKLWFDQWEWHHQSSHWLRGVSDAELEAEAADGGARLRGELLGLGPGRAIVEIRGAAAARLTLEPGERRSLDLPVGRGRFTVSVPAAAALGSPRLGSLLPSPRLLVVVLVDTLRDDYVTPDRMPGVTAAFAGGSRWLGATANCSWTLPSVASMFTSRPVLELTQPEGDLIGIPEGVPTWAEALEQAGFSGGAVVANYSVHVLNGFARGFASYLVPDGHGGEDPPDAGWVVGEGRRWLAAHRGEDAFLYLHLMDPHQPYRSHDDPTITAPDLSPLAMRRREATPEEAAVLRRLYAGEVRHVDRVLAPFLAELPGSATVVFTSDHGEALGEHGAWGHGLNLFQEALRVPLLIRGPGVPAAAVGEPVALLDLAPSLLELAGVEPGVAMAGRSLREAGPRAPLVSTTFGGGPLRWAWRDGRDKVVLRMAAQRGLGASSGTAMLEGEPLPAGGFRFDLEADPAELRPGMVPEELLLPVATAFSATAGRLVPGLQVMAWGRRGALEIPLRVAGGLEVVQAWSVGSMAVERDGELAVVRCAEAYPVCAAGMRLAPPPPWVEVAGTRRPIAELVTTEGGGVTDVRVWWNEDRELVVGGHRQTIERLRALGYIE